MQAYNEYQRFASVTGNVDSARLLLTYGVGYILQVTSSGHRLMIVRELFSAALSCDERKFQSLVQTVQSDSAATRIFQEGSHTADDGTTLLMAASFSGCQSIVDLILTMLGAAEDDDPIFDRTEYIEKMGSHGMNALMIAAAVGSDGVVSSILSVGHANINATHKFTASTALHMVRSCCTTTTSTAAATLKYTITITITTTTSNTITTTTNTTDHYCYQYFRYYYYTSTTIITITSTTTTTTAHFIVLKFVYLVVNAYIYLYIYDSEYAE